ncbi:MAG: hypothetical protein LUE87_01310 [Lachnospiraceae bacterium]|nr:hypothetical protein [Lachnospiraceae bacterium]
MLDLNLQKFVDWEVKGVMQIKGKYGYRIILKYMDGTERTQQKAGFNSGATPETRLLESFIPASMWFMKMSE